MQFVGVSVGIILFASYPTNRQAPRFYTQLILLSAFCVCSLGWDSGTKESEEKFDSLLRAPECRTHGRNHSAPAFIPTPQLPHVRAEGYAETGRCVFDGLGTKVWTVWTGDVDGGVLVPWGGFQGSASAPAGSVACGIANGIHTYK